MFADRASLLPHEHQFRLALEVEIGVATYVDRDEPERAARELMRRGTREIFGQRLAFVTPDVETRSCDRERAELGLDLPLADFLVAVVQRQRPGRVVAFLRGLLERR